MTDKRNNTPETRLAEALMAAVNEGADFQKTLEQIPEAERPKVQALLSGTDEVSPEKPATPAIVIAQPKEMKDLVEKLKLEEGYAEALETQEFFQLLKLGEKAPDFGQVLKTFTPEMLIAAQGFQSPRLVLATKGRSFGELVAAMDNHKVIKEQGSVRVGDEFSSKHDNQKAGHWGAHIIEAPTNVIPQDFDDIELNNGERFEGFNIYKAANNVGGVDRRKYAHLMMQSLIMHELLDSHSKTVLDEDPDSSARLMSFACWDPHHFSKRVVFLRGNPESRPHMDVCFRRSVGGIVQG